MGQYQVTAMLRDEEELERFAFGQRLARDEEKRVTWERHYRDAKRESENLQAEVERLKQEKMDLQKTLQSLKNDLKSLSTEKTEPNFCEEERIVRD